MKTCLLRDQGFLSLIYYAIELCVYFLTIGCLQGLSQDLMFEFYYCTVTSQFLSRCLQDTLTYNLEHEVVVFLFLFLTQSRSCWCVVNNGNYCHFYYCRVIMLCLGVTVSICIVSLLYEGASGIFVNSSTTPIKAWTGNFKSQF